MLWICVLLAQGTAAHAYVLPAEQILTLMLGRFGSAGSLAVFQKTALYDAALEGGIREVRETLYYRFPDRFRSEIKAPGLEQVQVVDQDRTLMILNNKIVGERQRAFDHFKDLLLYREAGVLFHKLSQLGINLQVVSLGRVNDRVVYVIGAKYPDRSVSQVWIDKESFKPVKLLLKDDRDDGALHVIEYKDYRSLDKGESYPTRILFFENHVLARMHVLDRVAINPDLGDRLFDIAYLKSASETLQANEPGALPETKTHDLNRIFE